MVQRDGGREGPAQSGEDSFVDHTSRPVRSPARTADYIVDLVEALRRQTKHGPARLAADLQRLHHITVASATVHRILVRRGLNRPRDLAPPTGEQLREVIRYEHDRGGDLYTWAGARRRPGVARRLLPLSSLMARLPSRQASATAYRAALPTTQ
ncbi:helix-turn-helix domain-containing protein [Streptomyces diastaticus]|uniref:helix-turn-helix domain-containing protein n=1 Tax=Streptomyces TaxID=1883 RepID=UPI000C257724|nr:MULTISPECIES: helix-turn-helix domain-containing protein [unclassified Streptomyces]MBL3806113.1 helix-turn-helix domain-containing protein [Streptomyces sp. BRB081]PJM80666.1 hypothetical protein CH313_27160 [Streptomyces sp. TSRI0384-2]RPK79837.1 hypothetical protein EES47_29145 [Streptomyces sp. ADI98-12]